MKLSHIITLFVAALFVAGCASKESASSPEEAAPATGSAAADDDGARAKTAYEGSTGAGLLMERYKSGNIEGYRK